ncbi:MAG: ATP-dependent zinc metalloprotease FtsH [Firmicutes bacterium]|nr:ATP-dependent zinc metalloprotease FtsH [Bacillota bacterium]
MKYSEFQDSVYSNNVKEIYVKNFKCYVLKNPSDIAPTNFMPAGNKYDYIVYVPSKQALTEFMDGYRTYAKDFNAGLDAYKAARSALPEDERADFDSLEENRPYVGAAAKIVTVYSLNDPEAGSIWSMLYPFLLVAGLIVVVVIVFRSLNNGNRQAMNFAKSKARLNQNIKVRFGDVAGADEEKEELQEIVEFLKNPKKFEVVGARIPKGVLLVGSPGTGKTLFAKAVAGEANVPFFSISGSDFVEMFVGVGASRVRDLFEDAKRYMPCIIFIDEIDAVGRQRGTGLGGSHDEREQTLNQLLVQMDGFETNSGIIIMAATNRADILDPALLRPGRFDRQIYVHLPDVRGREEIFKIHARNKPISPDVNFKNLARITSGLSGADIENILNEAAILAARANRTTINTVDINEGINKVQMGPQKKSRVVTEVDKRITAYHEAGHAIMAKSLPYGDPVHEVSIIQRGMAAGYTMMRPEREDDSHVSYNYLTDQIAMTMGGRAAEEIVIQDISTGAMGDIRQAATLARRMVTEWGMSAEIGPIYLGSTTELFLGRDYQSTTMYSEKVAAQIDGEIKKIVEKGHATALSVLKEKRDVMDKMVRLLIEKETIYGEDVDACMEGQPLDEIIAAMERRFENKKKPDSAAPAADGRVEH